MCVVGAPPTRVPLVGRAPNTHIARYVAQLPTVERDDTDALLTLFHLCSTRTITPTGIAPILQRTAAEAATILGRLALDPPGMVEPARAGRRAAGGPTYKLLSLIHISEPTRLGMISYAVFCLKKK